MDLTRRTMIGGALACAAPLPIGIAPGAREAKAMTNAPKPKGRIRQSVALWPFQTLGWTVEQTIDAAVALKCPSVELVDPADWPKLKAKGLTCAIALNGMPGAPFEKGLCNRADHDEVIGNTKRMIDACADSDGVCSQVIAFTGYKWRNALDPTSGAIPLDEGAEATVEGLRALGKYAAPKGVTISIEQLNTRDDTHPMKGHPGYMGNDMDWMAEVVRRADMPNVKLLFDIYHVQIMNGDVIRRLRAYADLISHVHVAGNPGRAELHTANEIGYPAIMEALVDVGYDGYVGQEFIPTGDPMEGLTRAVRMCDV